MPLLVLLLICIVLGFFFKGVLLALMHLKITLMIAAGAVVVFALGLLYAENGNGRSEIKKAYEKYKYKKGSREDYEKAVLAHPKNAPCLMKVAVSYDTGTDGFPFDPKEAKKFYDLARKHVSGAVKKFFEYYDYPSFANIHQEEYLYVEQRKRVAAALLLGENFTHSEDELCDLCKAFFGTGSVAYKVAVAGKQRNDQYNLEKLLKIGKEDNKDQVERAYANFLIGLNHLEGGYLFFDPDVWKFSVEGVSCSKEKSGWFACKLSAFDGFIPAMYYLLTHDKCWKAPYVASEEEGRKQKQDIFDWYLYMTNFEWNDIAQKLADAGFPDRNTPEDWPELEVSMRVFDRVYGS
ncbi:MAG: hypothetical protein LUI10_03420 [Lachnospiraceae bacterium]|nr:hypothetical protein [Lachnospiraceae bacterium]